MKFELGLASAIFFFAIIHFSKVSIVRDIGYKCDGVYATKRSLDSKHFKFRFLLKPGYNVSSCSRNEYD